MPNNKTLDKMTTSATALGWPVPVTAWPKTFETDFHVWTLDHATTMTDTGELQCAEYKDGKEWFIVYNE